MAEDWRPYRDDFLGKTTEINYNTRGPTKAEFPGLEVRMSSLGQTELLQLLGWTTVSSGSINNQRIVDTLWSGHASSFTALSVNAAISAVLVSVVKSPFLAFLSIPRPLGTFLLQFLSTTVLSSHVRSSFPVLLHSAGVV